MSQKTATHFLNVDLDLHAKSGLKDLLAALDPSVFVLNPESPDDHASVELSTQPQSVDEAIQLYYDLVQALPPPARALWDNCEKRTMDIGIQSGDHPHQTRYLLSGETIARLSSMKADVAFTVYAPPKD
jgi:hypothetical protein